MIPHLLSRITQELERAARNYIELSERLAAGAVAVAGVREPEKFRHADDLVKGGHIATKVVVRGNALDVYLADEIVFSFVSKKEVTP